MDADDRPWSRTRAADAQAPPAAPALPRARRGRSPRRPRRSRSSRLKEMTIQQLRRRRSRPSRRRGGAAQARPRLPHGPGRRPEERQLLAEGVLETVPDGYGFLRAPESATSRARTTSTSRRRDSPLQPAHGGHGAARSARPREGERYFALIKVEAVNFETPTRRATRSSSTT